MPAFRIGEDRAANGSPPGTATPTGHRMTPPHARNNR